MPHIFRAPHHASIKHFTDRFNNGASHVDRMLRAKMRRRGRQDTRRSRRAAHGGPGEATRASREKLSTEKTSNFGYKSTIWKRLLKKFQRQSSEASTMNLRRP
eukprot:6177050-Pleurochrysis_carterae.AAC.1